MKYQLPSLNRKETLCCPLFFLAQFLLIPMIASYLCDSLSINVSITVQNFICFLLNFLCTIALFSHFWLESLKSISGKVTRILRTVAICGAIYYISTFLLNCLILYLNPNFSNINDTAIATMVSEHRMLMIIGLVILVPPVEEFLYRGFLFGKLYPRSPFLAYFVSIVAFAAIHIVGYIGEASSAQLTLCFLQYLPAGFCLAAAYAYSGSLFAPILMHTIINFFGILAIYEVI